MNLQAFTTLLAARLHPVLRQEGFRGSGATLRRIDGPLVHVFNIQGGSGGERCYLNLGVALEFLAPQGTWQADRVLEHGCAFRRRIDPPPAHGAGWQYGDSPEAAEASALEVLVEWERQGRPFFATYARYPDDFATQVAAFSESDAPAFACLTMARIAIQLGDRDRARSIANSGLERAPERASGLKHSLRQLLAGEPAG